MLHLLGLMAPIISNIISILFNISNISNIIPNISDRWIRLQSEFLLDKPVRWGLYLPGDTILMMISLPTMFPLLSLHLSKQVADAWPPV